MELCFLNWVKCWSLRWEVCRQFIKKLSSLMRTWGNHVTCQFYTNYRLENCSPRYCLHHKSWKNSQKILGVKQALWQTLFVTQIMPKKFSALIMFGSYEKRTSGVQCKCIPGGVATSCYGKQHKLSWSRAEVH